MTDGPDPSDIEAPEIEPQDRFIAPDQPEDQGKRLEGTQPDPALEEKEPESEREERAGEDRVDESGEESFPASDPPAY